MHFLDNCQAVSLRTCHHSEKTHHIPVRTISRTLFLATTTGCESRVILLISIILITYLVLLRRFLLKHWRKTVSWFLIVVTTSLISIVSYYCNFHYTLFHMLRPRVYPTIRRLKALWDVTGPLIVIFLARRQHR